MTVKLRHVMSLALVAAIGAGGCTKNDGAGGLPPAKDWKGGAATTAPGTPPPGATAGDPHAGMDMGGAAAHPGTGAAGDPSAPAMAPDPTHVVRGTIKIGDALKGKIASGVTVWLYAKRPDPADPEGQRMPVVSDTFKLVDGQTFQLDENMAMATPGSLVGELVISARTSKSGDTMTREVGDFIGSVKVTAPAQDVVITIDTPVTPRTAPSMPAMGGGSMGMPPTAGAMPPATGTMPPGHP